MEPQLYLSPERLAASTKEELIAHILDLYTLCRHQDEALANDLVMQATARRVIGDCVELQGLFVDILSELAAEAAGTRKG